MSCHDLGSRTEGITYFEMGKKITKKKQFEIVKTIPLFEKM